MSDPGIVLEDGRGRCIVSNARSMAKKSMKDHPNWAFVSILFGVGSGRANALCREWKLDPNSTDAA